MHTHVPDLGGNEVLAFSEVLGDIDRLEIPVGEVSARRAVADVHPVHEEPVSVVG
jgi:hypothetical protein